ncbi:MAG: hypothetical protein E7218_08275 [Anaerofustis stercorihominis]|nr:hypothetical protein [Anaerofustis stercorihominis]
MKKTTKALALALCAVLLVVGTALTTVAYLMDSDEAVNTFTVGKVNINLKEADVTQYGEYELNEDGSFKERVTKNEYKLVPGLTYIKDPVVTVEKESEDCYVRILMTLNKQTELDAIFAPDGIDLKKVFSFDEGNWKYVGNEKKSDGTRTYEFRYKGTEGGIVKYSEEDTTLPALFGTFTCPWQITETQIETLEGFEISLEAHAIQAGSFEADAENNLTAEDVAWAAFDAQLATYPAEQ